MEVRIELKRVFIFETIKMHKTLLFKNCKISYNTKETFENIEVELLTCKIGYNT